MGKKPKGKTSSGWVYIIRIDLQDVGYGYMDWIGLGQDRQLTDDCGAVINLRVP